MNCTKCGTPLPPGAAACGNCGTPVAAGPVVGGGMQGNTSDKDWIVAVLLSFFLGGLGIDRFYLGYTTLGIVKLLTVGGCGVWALIDFILILLNKLPDADGRELRR